MAANTATSPSRSSRVGGLVGTVGDDHADTRAEAHLVVAERERLVEHRAQPVRQGEHVVDARDVVTHHRELVAAEPGELVAGTQHAAQPARGGREQLVAGFVSEAVVDDLEVVDVENHESDPRVVGRRGERGLQPLDEHHAVRQLGQRVVTRAVRELGLDPAVLAHVVRGADELVADTVGPDDRGDVDRDASRRLRSPLGLEGNGAALPCRGGEGADVRDERVGGDDMPQVAGGGVVASSARYESFV